MPYKYTYMHEKYMKKISENLYSWTCYTHTHTKHLSLISTGIRVEFSQHRLGQVQSYTIKCPD